MNGFAVAQKLLRRKEDFSGVTRERHRRNRFLSIVEFRVPTNRAFFSLKPKPTPEIVF